MTSPRTGNKVANQYIIEGIDTYFQSYDSIIAKDNGLNMYLDRKYWDYSRTTLKYLNQFLGTSSEKEIQERIKSGEYILTDLNK